MSKRTSPKRSRPEAASRGDAVMIEMMQELARHLVGVTARAWARTDAPRKLTLPGYRLLVVLSASAGMRPSQLARELGVTRAAITQMLGTLSRARLVSSQRVESDARQRLVTLTPRGRKVVASVANERARLLKPALSGLSLKDRRAGRTVLDRLNSALAGASR